MIKNCDIYKTFNIVKAVDTIRMVKIFPDIVNNPKLVDPFITADTIQIFHSFNKGKSWRSSPLKNC